MKLSITDIITILHNYTQPDDAQDSDTCCYNTHRNNIHHGLKMTSC
jgi:hypothetical protein